MRGPRDEDLIAFTPELRSEALEILTEFDWAPGFFNPPLYRDNAWGFKGAINCAGARALLMRSGVYPFGIVHR